MSFPVMGLASVLQQKFPLKWVILIGEIAVLAGTLLFPFADSKAHFWRFAFPGFFIGTAGMTIVFATTKWVFLSLAVHSTSLNCGVFSIAIFTITPPEVAGIVGAIFTCALQLGSAAGAAIITSIQTSVEPNHGGPNGFSGRAAGFWFLFAFNALLALCVLLFMRNTVPPAKKETVTENNKGGSV